MNRICMRDHKGDLPKVSPIFDAPIVIEGADVYDTLCPVSKLTGHRESAFKLLCKLTGAKSDLLNAVLQELPSIASDARLTDEDRVQALVSRLSTGTPAEDALMAERILADLDALGLSSKVDVPKVDDTIKFDSNDTNSPSDE